MKILLKKPIIDTGNFIVHLKDICNFTERERERERENVNTAVTFRDVMLS